MRILVMFDLPVNTKQHQREATRFRNFLLKDGYYMVQFSIYSRVCNGNDAVEKHFKRIKHCLPSEGSVRVLIITEKQFQNMLILLGEQKPNDKAFEVEQLTFF